MAANDVSNSFEIPGLQFSLEAGDSIVWRRWVAADAEGKAVQGTSAEGIVGVARDDAEAGNAVAIIGDGIAIIEAGAAIEAGAGVGCGTDGRASSGGTLGVALTEATAAGETIAVKF